MSKIRNTGFIYRIRNSYSNTDPSSKFKPNREWGSVYQTEKFSMFVVANIVNFFNKITVNLLALGLSVGSLDSIKICQLCEICINI